MNETLRTVRLTAVTLIGLLAAILFHVPLVIGLVPGLFLLVLEARKEGLDQRTLLSAMRSGLAHTLGVIFILLLVGAAIPVWSLSGTLEALVGLGISAVSPNWFICSAFLVSAAVGLVIGTSTGTLGTVGIALVAAGAHYGIPAPLIGGAVVSGALVGDRSSPISSARMLAAASTGLSMHEQAKAMRSTTVCAGVAAILFFGAWDLLGTWRVQAIAQDAPSFVWSFQTLLLLLSPVLLLAAKALRASTTTAFLLSIAASVAIGMVLNPHEAAISDWLRVMWEGYRVSPYFVQKGVSGMLELIALIAAAGAFNGLIERTRLLQPVLNLVLRPSCDRFGAAWRAVLFALGLSLIGCTQTLPIMMTGSTLLERWRTRFPSSDLARIVSDSSVVLPGLVPWNMMALLFGSIIGVSSQAYAPYAVWLWMLPFLTIAVSWWDSRGRNHQAEHSLQAR